jgi:hypothetical protein
MAAFALYSHVHCCVGLFGGALIAVKGSGSLSFHDWETGNLVRRVEIEAKNVFWSDQGHLVVIASEESFYVLKYNAQVDTLIPFSLKHTQTRIVGLCMISMLVCPLCFFPSLLTLSSHSLIHTILRVCTVISLCMQAVAEAIESGQEIEEDGIEAAFDVVSDVAEVIKTGKWVGDCFIYTNSGLCVTSCHAMSCFVLSCLLMDVSWILYFSFLFLYSCDFHLLCLH